MVSIIKQFTVKKHFFVVVVEDDSRLSILFCINA